MVSVTTQCTFALLENEADSSISHYMYNTFLHCLWTLRITQHLTASPLTEKIEMILNEF